MTWLPRYRDDDGFGMDVGSDGEYFLGHGVVELEINLSVWGSSASPASCGSVLQPTTRDSTAVQQHQPFSTRPSVPPRTSAIKSHLTNRACCMTSRSTVCLLIALAFASFVFAQGDSEKKSFSGRVSTCEISLQFPADAILIQPNSRSLLTIEVTTSNDPADKIGDVKKVGIHSPTITFGGEGATGRAVRCVVTRPASETHYARGSLSVIQK